MHGNTVSAELRPGEYGRVPCTGAQAYAAAAADQPARMPSSWLGSIDPVATQHASAALSDRSADWKMPSSWLSFNHVASQDASAANRIVDWREKDVAACV